MSKHTKLDYYECCAKIVLSELVSKDYENLYLRDKPDLQFPDGSRGIEVTQAYNPDHKMAESLWINIQRGSVRNKEGALKEIEKSGSNYNGFLLSSGPDSFTLILQAFKKKLETINKGHYAPFHHYDLFVFSEIYADNLMCQDALQAMIDLSLNYKLSFEKVWVSVPGFLYIFDLSKKQNQTIKIDEEVDSDMHYRAEKMVKAAM